MRNGFQFEAHLTSFVLMTLEFLVILFATCVGCLTNHYTRWGGNVILFYVGDDSFVQFASQIIETTSYEKFPMLQPIFSDFK
jgi:hypothetical protein